MKSFHGYLGSS